MIKTNDGLGPLITDIDGVELSDLDKEVLQHPKLGGLIFFSRNYESYEQLIDLVRCIRELRPELLLTVDHEGGRVQRFREGFSRIPAMASCGAKFLENPDEALTWTKELGWLLAYELTSIGIDHSFAPVLDLDDHQSQVIGDRSFSPIADHAIELAGAFIDGMRAAGMAATAKHFPGHGSVVADSHLELPVDQREFSEIWRHDMKPFVALKSNYKAIMTAHVAFPDVDDKPVSFSSEWLESILRKKIGFSGLVISDDLSMKGADKLGGYQSRAYTALNAGCDAILICNQRDQAEYVLEFLESDQLGEQGKLDRLKSTYKPSVDELDAEKHALIKQRLEVTT